MRVAFRTLLLACALSVASGEVVQANERAIAPILTTAEAKDAKSYAQPLLARVTHVDLDLDVDFSTKKLSGLAVMDVQAAPGATSIVLDSLDLDIAWVRDDQGRDLQWSLGASDPELGAPLTVKLAGARARLRTRPRRGRRGRRGTERFRRRAYSSGTIIWGASGSLASKSPMSSGCCGLTGRSGWRVRARTDSASIPSPPLRRVWRAWLSPAWARGAPPIRQ